MFLKGIRIVALALIAFPEPTTTVLGILILCATFIIFKQPGLKKFGNLEVLVSKSLQKEEPPVGFRRYIAGEPPIVNHAIKQNLASQPDNISEKAENIPISSQYSPWFDNRKVSENTLRHTLKTGFPQYESAPDLVQNSSLQATILKNNQPAVQHHKLKSSLIPDTNEGSPQPGLNKCFSLCTEPVVHHALKVG
jgi:hypothetical protein